MVLVAVLNWNGERDTIECLQSLARSDYARQRIVVLDNGSRPGSVEAIESALPAIQAAHPALPLIEIVRNGANLGYAGGNNVGLRLAAERGADYCLVLNNDIAVAPDTVRLLVAAAERDPRLLVLGPRVYRADAPDELFYPGWTIDWRRWLFHRLAEPPSAGEDGLADVAFVQGCALMVRVNFLRRCDVRKECGTAVSEFRNSEKLSETAHVCCPGFSRKWITRHFRLKPGQQTRREFEQLEVPTSGFDERFFLYCEDADLSLRAQRAGGRTVEVVAARAWHKGYGSSGRDSPLKIYYGWRNRWLFISKHAAALNVPWRHRWMLRAQLLFGDAGATAWRCVRACLRGDRHATRTLRALARAIADALAGRYGRGPDWF